MIQMRQSQTLGLLLWAQTLFVGSTFRSLPVMTGIAFLITSLVFFRLLLRKQPATVSGQPHKKTGKLSLLLGLLSFLSTLAITGQWRSGNQLSEEVNYVYLVIDTLAHACIFFSLLLWAIKPLRGHPSMIPFGCVVALMSCAAGGASSSLAAQTAIALTICVGFLMGSNVVLKPSHGFISSEAGGSGSAVASKWLAPIFSLLSLSVLMMGTSGIANGTSFILPTIQSRLQEELQTSFNSMSEETFVGGTRYVRGSELGSLRQHMLGDPAEVAVQSYCKFPPGYLRGSVFDRYSRGGWLDSGSYDYQRYTRQPRIPDSQIQTNGVGTASPTSPIPQPLNHFQLVDQELDKTITVEVLSDPSKGSVIFTPLASYWIEASSEEISFTAHGVVRSGIDVRRPYLTGVGKELPPTVLSDELDDATLRLPSSLADRLSAYGSSLVGSSQTAREKAKAISEHFQSEYGYSLNPTLDRPRNIDPIDFFLTAKHDAHCEFFASATVLLLRSIGVNSRYVTGYVVDELSEEQSELWLGRNRDAHAWAEAFDPVSGTWFPVESTPGLIYRTVQPEQLDMALIDADGRLLEDTEGVEEGWLERLISWFVSIRVTEPILIAFRISQLPLFIGLSFYLWKRYHGGNAQTVDKDEIKTRRMLRRVDRLMRRSKFTRSPSETLWQFADRINESSSRPDAPAKQRQLLNQCAEWYRQYAVERYQGNKPKPLILK